MKTGSLPVSRSCVPYWKAAIGFLFVAGGVPATLSLASAADTTATTMTLTADGSPVTTVEPHTAIMLTATVKAGSTVLKQGQVKFCDARSPSCQDIHLLGVSQLTAAGTATLKFVSGPGCHRYQAVFLGTNVGAPSISAVSAIAVTSSELYTSKTTLVTSGIGGSYTLKADVSGLGTTAPPTGTVYFQDRSDSFRELGKAQLSTGLEELSWPAYKFGKLETDVQGMATADFNNDGHADLAAGGAANGIRLLFGDGKGLFTESILPFKVPDPYYSLVLLAGDFNNDGNADLIIPGAIFLGNGDGTFKDGPKFRFGDASMVSADFNGDGNADLIEGSTYGAGASVQIALGNGDGTFQKAKKIDSREGYNLVVGDFDGDGKADFALPDFSFGLPSAITFYFGNGDGTFLKKRRKGPRFMALTAADVNGDGRTDLIVSGQGISTASTYVYVLSGHRGKTFTQGPLQYEPVYSTNGFGGILGDYNGDGLVDVAYNGAFADYPMTVLLGDGTGSFAPSAITGPLGMLGADFFVGGDFNEDGAPDIAATVNPRRSDYHYSIFFTRRNLAVAMSGKAPRGPDTHEVVARYHGDDTFESSVSKPVELTALAGVAPVATFSALAVPFGEGTVGEPSNAKTVVLTNTGTAALAIGSVALSPLSKPGLSFASSNNCPASLAQGAACKIRFRFVPGSTGVKTNQLTITDNARNSPQVITLSGTGVAE